MKLTVHIDAREAVPVRAIPFITGWGLPRQISLDPGHLAHHLASGKFIAGFAADHPLTAHRLHRGGAVSRVNPSDWGVCVADIQELGERCERDGISHPLWRKHVITVLPQCVFVWLDDFNRFWINDYLPKVSMAIPTDDELMEDYAAPPDTDERQNVINRLSVLSSRRRSFAKTCPPPPTINLAPFVDEDTAKRILEGFESAHPENQTRIVSESNVDGENIIQRRQTAFVRFLQHIVEAGSLEPLDLPFTAKESIDAYNRIHERGLEITAVDLKGFIQRVKPRIEDAIGKYSFSRDSQRTGTIKNILAENPYIPKQ